MIEFKALSYILNQHHFENELCLCIIKFVYLLFCLNITTDSLFNE